MNANIDEDLRKRFELACLFPNSFNPSCGKANMLVKLFDKYKSKEVEAAFQGYKMGVRSTESKLERANPERYISNGFITQVLTILDDDETIVTPEICKAVLQVAKSTPV